MDGTAIKTTAAAGAMLLAGCAILNDPRIAEAPLTAKDKEDLRAFFGRPKPRAFAFAPETGRSWHAWGYPTRAETERVALAKCEELGSPCVLYAVDDEVVWMPGAEPAAVEPPLSRAELAALRRRARTDREAAFDLGNRYLHGIGVERDLVEARSWLERAARNGHPTAAYELGLMHELGRGVPVDRAAALRWYRRAAAAGHEEATRKVVALGA